MAEQSRRMSFVESVANVAIGYGIALLTQLAVSGLRAARLAGAKRRHRAIFTVVSIVAATACAACSSGCA